jgi:hypothetical protein
MDHDLTTLTSCTLAFIPHAAVRAVKLTRPNLAAALWRETLVDSAIFREWDRQCRQPARDRENGASACRISPSARIRRPGVGWKIRTADYGSSSWEIAWDYRSCTPIGCWES